MNSTMRLKLPFLAAGQAQKEVIVNEALQIIDVAVAAAVDEPPRSTPPAIPAVGSCFLVGPAPTGAWAGHAGHLAAFTGAGWRLVAPVEGMRTLIRSSGMTASYLDGEWQIGVMPVNKITVSGQQVVGARGAAIPLPTGGSTVDTEARAALSAIIARLKDHGLIA